MKRLISLALLCLTLSASAPDLPSIPFNMTASVYPNAANYYWVEPGQGFSLTYQLSSTIGTNLRTFLKQTYVGPALVTSVGTIPAAPTPLYLYDTSPSGTQRTLTLAANPSKSTPREITVAFDQCVYISDQSVLARPAVSQLGGAFGFIINQLPANSIITNTGTKGSQTTISLWYSSNGGTTWTPWSGSMSARYNTSYKYKVAFTCSSTTKLGKFTINAFGVNQVIYDTQYDLVLGPQSFSGDVSVKFSSAVSTYPIDI